MSIRFNCPPVGPTSPDGGECGVTKGYAWTSNSSGFVRYYLPGMDKSLISFYFNSTINNGSNIVIDLIYNIAGVATTVETWNLGTLPRYVQVYHYLDFKTNLSEVDKFIEFKITTTNGTSGEMTITSECNIEVTNALFCTGGTRNDANECFCRSSNNVRIYTRKEDSLNYSFPYYKSAWYLDPVLSIPAPCGDYMNVESESQAVYTYDCGIYNDTYVNYTCGNCTEISCGSGQYIATHTGYTESHPYLDSATSIIPNGLVYSIKCFNLKLSPSKNNIYVPITFTYNGLADDVCFTLSDPGTADNEVGLLTYSEFLPSKSPFFNLMTNQTLIRFEKGQTSKTIWVIPPLSKILKIRMAVGQSLSNLKRTVTTKAVFQCGTPFYAYLAGLHTYSAYDSINNPKLTTYIYSFVPISNWGPGTVLFADRICTQPAYPYYYGINNLVYKVGDPFLREVGIQKEIFITKKLGEKEKVTERILQGNWMQSLPNGEKRSPACVVPFMSMGIISKIMAKSTLKKPTTYLYFMGYSQSDEGGGNKVASNNDFFTIYDGENQKPVTGFEHAGNKLDESWRQGFTVYLSKFGQDVQFTYENIARLAGIAGLGIAANIGLGVLSASLLYLGLSTSTPWLVGATLQLLCPGAIAPLFLQLSVLLGVSTLGLGLIIAAIVIALLAIFGSFEKTVREECKLFYIRYNAGPYMNPGDIIWINSIKTISSPGFYCDGGYFYTYNDLRLVTKKELAYKEIDGVKTNSIKPDDPVLVVNLPQLLFLPYVSGRPQTY